MLYAYVLNLAFVLFLPTILSHSTVWMWKAEMPAAKRRCPTLGGLWARSARTYYSNTVAPTTPAAWPPCPHPTWAAATPTSTTTTPSVSSTAVSASCRSQKAAADEHPPKPTRVSSQYFLLCFSHCVTQNQYARIGIRSDGPTADIPPRWQKRERLGFRTLYIVYFILLFFIPVVC